MRLATLVVVGTYVQLGPIWTQLLSQPRQPYLKTWTMYRGFGQDICRVKFDERQGDAVVERDRFKVLSQTWASSPAHIKFIPSVVQVARTGLTMCRHLGAGADLRVTGECGSDRGWRPLRQLADVNLCELSEAQVLKLQSTKRKRRAMKARTH
jgi:hypothetical protein